MNDKRDWVGIRLVSIAFAGWIDESCIKSFTGYFLRNGISLYDTTEFKIDELYDYWFENILLPEINSTQ